jgi:ABC-type multidrug transport system ATPase subunit
MKKPTPEEERAQKLILNHVSGAVLPGQLLAIMGASGAPKPIPSISLHQSSNL